MKALGVNTISICTRTLSRGAVCLTSFFAIHAYAESGIQPPMIEEVHIYGEPGQTQTATKLNLSIYETPQTISVISPAQIEDFALNDINTLLDYAPGVTVEDTETDRVYYTARGFDIVNFQYDGVGVPFTFGLAHGHQDTAVFEQVEVVKGAAGLITGLANPSATINYIRKRPKDELHLSAGLSVGEWNQRRIEGDVSTPVAENLRTRFVVAKDDGDSYIDRHGKDNSLAYGIIEADLTSSTVFTLGYSWNESYTDGSFSGALPLHYTDGSATDYDVSTSTAPEWAYREVDRSQLFAELKQSLSDNWSLNAVYTQNNVEQDAEQMYVYGVPDKETELGLNGWASSYKADEEQRIGDIYLDGVFSFAGRQHQLVVGVNYADIGTEAGSYFDSVNGYPVLGSDWAAGTTPRPDFSTHNPDTDSADIDQIQQSVYFASRLHLLDPFSILVGARHMSVTQHGMSYGENSDTDADKLVPYLGFTYEIVNSLALYGSYSEVFVPQTWVDENFAPFKPTEGNNAELGLKLELNDGLANASFALFESNLENLGEYVGRINGVNVYDGKDYSTQGFELDATGAVSDSLNVSVGYTYLDIENQQGDSVRTFIPRNLLKVAAGYNVPGVDGLKLGTSVKWQSDIYTTPAADVRVTQDSFVVADVFIHYQFASQFSLALNIDNITDEKYYTSLYWTQSYYAPSRNAQLSLGWQF